MRHSHLMILLEISISLSLVVTLFLGERLEKVNETVENVNGTLGNVNERLSRSVSAYKASIQCHGWKPSVGPNGVEELSWNHSARVYRVRYCQSFLPTYVLRVQVCLGMTTTREWNCVIVEDSCEAELKIENCSQLNRKLKVEAVCPCGNKPCDATVYRYVISDAICLKENVKNNKSIVHDSTTHVKVAYSTDGPPHRPVDDSQNQSLVYILLAVLGSVATVSLVIIAWRVTRCHRVKICQRDLETSESGPGVSSPDAPLISPQSHESEAAIYRPEYRNRPDHGSGRSYETLSASILEELNRTHSSYISGSASAELLDSHSLLADDVRTTIVRVSSSPDISPGVTSGIHESYCELPCESSGIVDDSPVDYLQIPRAANNVTHGCLPASGIPDGCLTASGIPDGCQGFSHEPCRLLDEYHRPTEIRPVPYHLVRDSRQNIPALVQQAREDRRLETGLHGRPRAGLQAIPRLQDMPRFQFDVTSMRSCETVYSADV